MRMRARRLHGTAGFSNAATPFNASSPLHMPVRNEAHGKPCLHSQESIKLCANRDTRESAQPGHWSFVTCFVSHPVGVPSASISDSQLHLSSAVRFALPAILLLALLPGTFPPGSAVAAAEEDTDKAHITGTVVDAD